MCSKEPYIPEKEPYIPEKEPYIPEKEPYISRCAGLYIWIYIRNVYGDV